MKQQNFLNKIFFAILAGSVLLACNPTTAIPTSGETTPPEYGEPIRLPTAPVNNSVAETEVTFGQVSLIVPSGVASGASGTEYPRENSDDAAYWQKTPGHIQIMLDDYYVLQGKFHQPVIYVYPAQAYAEMVPLAFESIRRVNNIIYGSATPISADQLPGLPFFNARQVFAAKIEAISFQNGDGVRFLTQYAQYPAPANNHELFYHFQGVTRDGTYYLIAIFPVTAPELAETNDPAAAQPVDGVTYPDMSDSKADWDEYYSVVTDLLSNTPADSFTPQLGQLDALINSLMIATP